MGIIEGDRVAVIQVSAFLRVKEGEWSGLAYWRRPCQPAGWAQLLAKICEAFGLSVEQSVGLDSVKAFSCNYRLTTLGGGNAEKFRNVWDSLPDNSPVRVVWEPAKVVRFGPAEDN